MTGDRRMAITKSALSGALTALAAGAAIAAAPLAAAANIDSARSLPDRLRLATRPTRRPLPPVR
jgi:hypothetical protein